MKKLLTIILVLAMMFSVTTGTSFAADPFAEQIKVDQTSLDKELAGAGDDVQQVIEFIDEKEIVTNDEIDSEAELEAIVGVDIVTAGENNDAADDLSDNVIGDLSNVDETGKVAGKILKYDASGNLIVADDNVGTTTAAQEKFTGDDTTVAFVTANAFASNTLVVYLNGLKRELAVDYTEDSNTGFTMTTAPKAGWVVEVTYNEA